MLLILGVVLAAVLLGAGYWLGSVRTSRQIADRLRSDPATGRAVLEELAGVWGAKLEMFSLPAADGGG
jgi:uncharacterized protein YneF (UPF0154 family)